jgi:hypothetical protein
MTIGDLCEFKTNFPDADFWLVKKGNKDEIGTPVKTFSPENIGVKVIRTDVLVPDYLYYVFMNIQNQGVFDMLSDVNDGGNRVISINKLKQIPIGNQ